MNARFYLRNSYEELSEFSVDYYRMIWTKSTVRLVTKVGINVC